MASLTCFAALGVAAVGFALMVVIVVSVFVAEVLGCCRWWK